MLKYKKFIKLLFLVLLVILPWFLFSGNDHTSPEKITSDLRFYEINTCSIPLGNFLLENINVIYQDHYKIRTNNYSSIKCYGQITGIDQINDVFYISIGTNSLINLFVSGLFFYICLSFIPNSKIRINIYTKNILLTSLISSIIIIVGILGQNRYYEKSFYIYDLNNYWQISNLYLIFFLLSLLYMKIFQEKYINLITYSPFVYIFIGIISGFNLSLIIILFINIGVNYFIENLNNLKTIFLYLVFLVGLWVLNLYSIGEKGYYLKPDKIIGLIFTEYNIYSILYTSSLLFSLVVGIKFITTKANNHYDFRTFSLNLILASNAVFLIGFFSANFPFFNFLSKYYLGPQKVPTDQVELFKLNEWNVLIPWRGFYPSAESIGEFYALSILIFTYFLVKNRKHDFNYTNILYMLLPLFGLILSNNRAAIFLLFIPLIYFMFKKFQHKLKQFYLIIFTIFSIFLINNSLNFSSNKIYQNLIIYSKNQNISQFGNYILESESIIFNLLISFFSIVSVLINRSELWSIFIVKFNPNYFESFLGSGPYNLSKYYSEIKIDGLLGFVLPHSSVLNLLIFFGLFNVLLFGYILLKKIFKYKFENKTFNIYILLFISINLIKSDSLLYVSSLIFYLIIYYLDFDSQKSS